MGERTVENTVNQTNEVSQEQVPCSASQTTSIKIDPEFQALLPKLSEEEFAQLEARLKVEGCLDALVVWKEKRILLDGHNRYAICQKHNIPFKMVEMSFASETDAKIWVLENQDARRNLTPFEHGEMVIKLKQLYAEQAKQRQEATSKNAPRDAAGHLKPVVSMLTPPDDGKTRTKLAKQAGVSTGTFHKIEKIIEKADDATKEKLRNKETTINAEYTRLTGTHVSHNTGEVEWYTPKEYIAAAREAMGDIDCDPSSCAKANETVKAKVFFDKDEDGLNQKWGKRVWMNPPYKHHLVTQFSEGLVSRLKSGEVEQGCVLVNNSTDADWCQSLLEACSATCFINGRVKFQDSQGKQSGVPLQGQIVVYLGKNVGGFCKAFGGCGVVLKP